MNSDKSSIKVVTSKLENGSKENIVKIEAPFNWFQCVGAQGCDMQKVCRICLFDNRSDMISLLSTEDTEMLADMFMSLTSIQIHPEDNLPGNICTTCKVQLVQSYEFKGKCERSDSTLKSLLTKNASTKDEPCDTDTTTTVDTQIQYTDVKIEGEIIDEDAEYLEDDDNFSDNESLCIVQETGKRKKNNLNITFTDSKSLLNEIVSGKKLSKKKRKHKSFECDYCSKIFLKAKTLKAHIKHKHNQINTSCPHACGQCKDSFTSEIDLELHMALHSKNGVWRCNKCHKEFNTRAMLRRHIQRHMESKRFSCETCGKTFTELYALRRHQRVHTGETREKKHACHMCDKRYSESSQLAAHVARHSGARPCVCAACGKAFPSPRLLASHRLIHTDRKPHACRYCDKRFRHESTRNTHHRTHTGEKPYVCATCGKTFIQNSNLTLHMRTHTGERPYSCNICDRKFTSGSSLKCHQRTHTGEKPYSCKICGKSFARMNMNVHMRHHTGERPYKCSVCDKNFVSSTRLREHFRIHTGEKPFECATCAQKFATKSHLVKHLKAHQIKKKNVEKRDVVILQQVGYDQPFILTDKFVITENDENTALVNIEENIVKNKGATDESIKDLKVQPLEVTGELVLQGDNDMNTQVLIVDNHHDDKEFQTGNICLSTSGVNIVNNEINYGTDVNLVTVNEGEVSISASSAMLEGTTVKLYQLDQSLVEIHRSGNHLTISKITSKMTANF